MIITAIFLYDIIVGSLKFSWWYGFLAFLMDIILVGLIRQDSLKIKFAEK